jgi:photosystem II Psb27 protein
MCITLDFLDYFISAVLLISVNVFIKIKDGVSPRREFLKTVGITGAASASTAVFPFVASAEIEVPPQVTEYTFPDNWGLTFNYEEDAKKVKDHMFIATGLGKGANKMEDFGKNMKKEMVDFVSYYRRFPKIAGRPSISTLYTSINVLAGHYTSYGFKYPLPEKRRKRLYQEYAEIEKSLKRGR